MARTQESLAVVVERIAKQLLVAVQRFRASPENPTPPASAVEQAAKQICLMCDGKKQPPGSKLKRGQCRNCYQKTQRRLTKGPMTEAALIRAGKYLPAAPGGRRDADFPLDALADAQGILDDQNKEQRRGGKRRKPAHHKT